MHPEQLSNLLNKKFGKHRGRNTRAAKAIGMHTSNLSSALGGGNPLPQKHIDTLNALPDYAPPTGITQELYEDGVTQQLITFFTVRLTSQASRHLEIAARFATKNHNMPDFAADEDATARFFELIMNDYLALLRSGNPTAFHKTMDVMAQEEMEARRQLNLELNERKHLVADELTENEIFEDEDPLA